jgi:serine/threonine-protein kinase RsbW
LQHITFRISSRLDDVPLLGRMVNALCTDVGLTATDRNQVEVSVVEAVNNSIKHAYGGDPTHAVELDVSISCEELVFDIWDSGRSADPEWIHKDHSQAFDIDVDHLETAPESGRGLAIIQTVMDTLEYTPGDERNRCRLTKRLRGN